MPSWSVLTSGWVKRTEEERGGERKKQGRQREGFKIGPQGERKARRGRREMKGQKSFMPYAWEAKEGETGI